MNKFLVVFLLVFLFPVQVFFGEDRVVQSIGIVIDRKSPNYNVERILKKVILSVAVSNKNVKLFSSDSADIEYTGIKELNGTVLIKTVKKAGVYQVELYQIDNKTNRFDETVRLALKGFSDRVDDIAIQIVSNISVQFPPKPMKELTKIDLVKVKLSEYESQEGFWSLTVIPAYSILKIYYSTMSIGPDSMIEKTFLNNGVSLDLEATYRVQQWNFMLGAGGSYGGWGEGQFHGTTYDMYFTGMAGYGIFGSLIILGIQPYYHYGSFSSDYYDIIYTTNVPAPDVTAQILQINLYIQINISKDYYIVFSGGPPIPADFFSDMWLDFNKNGLYPLFTKTKLSPLYTSGMPMLQIKFNFRIIGSWWMQLFYDSGGPGFWGDTGATDDAKKPVPMTKVMSSFFMQNFSYTKTRIGLGVQYEF